MVPLIPVSVPELIWFMFHSHDREGLPFMMMTYPHVSASATKSLTVQFDVDTHSIYVWCMTCWGMEQTNYFSVCLIYTFFIRMHMWYADRCGDMEYQPSTDKNHVTLDLSNVFISCIENIHVWMNNLTKIFGSGPKLDPTVRSFGNIIYWKYPSRMRRQTRTIESLILATLGGSADQNMLHRKIRSLSFYIIWILSGHEWIFLHQQIWLFFSQRVTGPQTTMYLFWLEQKTHTFMWNKFHINHLQFWPRGQSVSKKWWVVFKQATFTKQRDYVNNFICPYQGFHMTCEYGFGPLRFAVDL